MRTTWTRAPDAKARIAELDRELEAKKKSISAEEYADAGHDDAISYHDGCFSFHGRARNSDAKKAAAPGGGE